MATRTVVGLAASAPAITPRESAGPSQREKDAGGATSTCNPKRLAGAAACLDMLRQIQRLPIVKGPPRDDLADAEGGPDDGKRMDYTTADRLLGEALNMHGANTGFRQALANFLLGEFQFGNTDIAQYSAEQLLTDGGFRPLPVSDVEARGAESLTIADDRVKVGLEATWEVDALCALARNLAEDVGHTLEQTKLVRIALQLRGVVLRIDRLNSALMSIFDDDVETRDLQRSVLGFVARKDATNG